tara:strand:+ start:3209 stop:3409 length:201 start_codon:yes stop_codon:yes gene_type:complete
MNCLTTREKQMLLLLAQGHTSKGAARMLGISEQTAKDHTKTARLRLQANTTMHAVAIATTSGLLAA